MEIKKVTELVISTTDGQRLVEGTKVVYSLTDGTCHCGIFNGVNNRNNLLFNSLLEDKEVSVMPKTIKSIYKANINIVEVEKM